jgi:hypothetical protein
VITGQFFFGVGQTPISYLQKLPITANPGNHPSYLLNGIQLVQSLKGQFLDIVFF